MPFSRPTLNEIITRIISDFNTRVVDSVSFLRRSVFKIFANVYGGALHLVYDYLQYIKDQLFISTADVEHLERHAAEYGLSRDAGTAATGIASATGTNGTTIPAGSQVQDSDGYKYNVTAAATIASGTANLNLQAESVGDAYNQDASTILSFVSAIAGVDANVTVDSNGITNGEDAETDAELRTRVLERKQKPPHGGTHEDYETWAKEYTGITRAWCIEEYQGIGTVGLVAVNDNDSPIFLTETERLALKNYVISHTDSILGTTVGIPITAEPGFFVIDAQPKTMNFTIQLYPNTAAVQSAVQTNLETLIEQKGGPGNTIEISEMYEAIATATGEEKSKIDYPTADVAAAVNEVHVMGTITWSTYNG